MFQFAEPSNKLHDNSIVFYDYFKKMFDHIDWIVCRCCSQSTNIQFPAECDVKLTLCRLHFYNSFGKNRDVDQQWIFIFLM